MSTSPTLIFLIGPTASGKTQLAIEMCVTFPCEIISVDSAMVYRGMNIGTGKPTAGILKHCPHHLVDICEPSDDYSAGHFRLDACRLIDDIIARGKTPLLVGGTMMYFNILLRGLADLPRADANVREHLTARINQHGLSSLHTELKVIDQAAAARIDPHDSQRIQRALEVYMLTGETITALQQKSTSPLSNYNINLFALNYSERATLHARIATRFQQMLTMGLIEEVKSLKNNLSIHSQLPAMRSIGYAQVWQFLDDQIPYLNMVENSIAATRQLAKRQLTWLRRFENLSWLNAEEDISTLIQQIQNKIPTG